MRIPKQSKDIDLTQHNWPIISPHLQIAFSTSFFRLLEFDNFSVVVLRVDLAIKVKSHSAETNKDLVAFSLARAASLSVFTCSSWEARSQEQVARSTNGFSLGSWLLF